MELTQLRYFLSVATTQHMTRSAELLHIAQPALSKAIAGLEKELGVPLFERRGRGLFLTPCGALLRDRLLPLTEDLDRLPHDLKRLMEQEEQTIRIQVLSASIPVTEAIIAYRRSHPKVHFQLLQNDTTPADIVITSRLSSQTPNGVQHILEEELYLAVPDEEDYRGIDTIPLAAMKDRSFISLAGSRQLRILCDRFCRQAGFAPNTVFESDNPTSVKNMIEAGLGVGFWPTYAWGERPEGSVRLLHTDPFCHRELLFSCHPSSCNRPCAEDFFAFLIHSFEKKRAK